MIFLNNYIYLFRLCRVFVAAWCFLAEVSRGYSLVAVCRFLIAATSLVAKGLSFFVTCEIFLDQG